MSRTSNVSSDVLPAKETRGDGVSSVFLLPGVFGDEPQLADLRAHLAERVAFHTIELPDVKSPVSLLSSIAETARWVVDDIVQVQRDGPLYIVGFSFGASLALEVASRLDQADRVVAFLGLIDGPLKVKDLKRIWSVTPAGLFAIFRRAFQKLKERLDLHLAERSVVQEAEISEPQRRARLLHLRAVALELWTPPDCKAVGLIFLSKQLYGRTSKTWFGLCPNCRQVAIASDHEHVILGESLYRVAAALADDIDSVKQRIGDRKDPA